MANVCRGGALAEQQQAHDATKCSYSEGERRLAYTSGNWRQSSPLHLHICTAQVNKAARLEDDGDLKRLRLVAASARPRCCCLCMGIQAGSFRCTCLLLLMHSRIG